MYRNGTFYDLSNDVLEKKPLKALSPEAQRVRTMLQGALDQYKDARPAASYELRTKKKEKQRN
ncbi:MAG: hypothetical protein ABFD92_04125 [Planctomycetaceae bacterium]|nr:hypothetical protein [Planctomycetaceae bacterium]